MKKFAIPDRLQGKAISPRSFVAMVFAAALIGLTGIAGVVLGTVRAGRNNVPRRVLLEYQMAKLTAPTAQTIFVGDSSLGNSIDVQLWSQLSGKSATNLALTAGFGYAATYNMIRRSLRHGMPRNVIIMQSTGLMSRTHSETAYDLTVGGEDHSWFGPLAIAWRLTMNADEFYAAFRWLRVATFGAIPVQNAQLIDHDYIRQGPKMTMPANLRGLQPGNIRLDQRKYLKLLASVCRDNDLNCIYVNGPIAAELCEKSDAYFKSLAEIIRAEGLRLLNEHPFCIPPEAQGDSIDHVTPSAKAAFTQRYYEALRPYLQ